MLAGTGIRSPLPGLPPSTFPVSVSRTNPMPMTRTSRAGLGPASWALLALFHAGCQPGATPSDRPTPLPSLGVEAAGKAPAATAPMAGPESSADNAPAIRPIESLEQEALKVEQTVDRGVARTVGEVERAELQPLPPPTAPAPELTPALPLPAPAA